MIVLFDGILARTIEHSPKDRNEVLSALARRLSYPEWIGCTDWAVEGNPYIPNPGLVVRFDELLAEMAKLDEMGRAELSTELAKQLFLINCANRTFVLSRYRQLLNWVEKLSPDLQAKPRNALGRAIRWLPENERIAEYQRMLDAASQLHSGEALAGLPEALIGLTAAQQGNELQKWKDEILPTLTQVSDQEPVVDAFISAFNDFSEGTTNPEAGLVLALDTFDKMFGSNNMNEERLERIVEGIATSTDHRFSPKTLHRILNLNKNLSKIDAQEWHLLRLEAWLEFKMLDKLEKSLLPVQARIQDERSKLAPKPLFAPVMDPVSIILEPREDVRHQSNTADQSGNNRRYRSTADRIRAWLGRR